MILLFLPIDTRREHDHFLLLWSPVQTPRSFFHRNLFSRRSSPLVNSTFLAANSEIHRMATETGKHFQSSSIRSFPRFDRVEKSLRESQHDRLSRLPAPESIRISSSDVDRRSDEVQRLHNLFYEGHVEFRSLDEFDDELREVGVQMSRTLWSVVCGIFFDPRAGIGDAARFLLLHRLGGVYVDVDTLFLRDLQPLFAYEFAYKWSYVDGFNTAVLRLLPQSNVSALIIERGKQSQEAKTFYPLALHRYGLPASFHRLPCAFFDTIWPAVDGTDRQTQREWKVEPRGFDGFKDPFRTTSEISRRGRHVFEGAFTFHWHSSSGLSAFQTNSYFHEWRTFLEAQVYESSNET